MTDADDRLPALTPAERERVVAALTRAAVRDQDRDALAPRDRGDGPPPLSPAQQRLWLVHQLHPETKAYNEATAWRVRGPLDAARLERCLTACVRRHEILRTTFPSNGDEPAQAIAAAGDVRLPVVDLSAVPADERQGALSALLRDEGRWPFDLEHGPLVRFALWRLGPDDHVFALFGHHLVLDGWSVGVFHEELSALYADALMPLPDPPLQYGDYAAWQRRRVAHDLLADGVRYWADVLRDPPPPLRLPAAAPRPDREAFAGARVTTTLAPAIAQRLDALCLKEQTSLFTGLLAAFQVLLSRATGERDVVVGTAVAGRREPVIERMTGFFVNTLALRGTIDPRESFRALVGRTRETVLDAFEHDDVPFDLVVDAVGAPRSTGHNPLFQAMLVLDNAPTRPLALAGADVTSIEVELGIAKYDLTLFVRREGGGLTLIWEHNTDLLDRDAAQRLADQLGTLLAGATADPDAAVATLSLLSATERERIVTGFNLTDAPVPDRRLHQLVEDQAARTPEAIAVVCGERRLAYRDLDRQANGVAALLRRRDVRPGARVGLRIDRSVEQIAAVLGVLKAGAAYVPLDPALPAERQDAMRQDAAVDLVLERDDVAAAEPADHPPAVAVGGDALAYVLFTSGSTGRPKGVMVTHDAVVASTVARLSHYEEPVGRFLLLPSPAVDSAVAGLFWTLAAGGALVVALPDDVTAVARLRRICANEAVTHLLTIPSLYDALLDGADPAAFAELRCAIVAGEPCRPAVVARHHAVISHAELFNEYGPTEATVWATVHRCDATAGAASGRVPVGRPIANTRIHVLDAALDPVPVGWEGEVYIGGAGVAHGYAGRPDLDALAFVPDPFRPGGRLYRTGDRGALLSDGTLDLRGRLDDQVKVRGFRLELGEVEQALGSHPGVRDAAAAVSDDGLLLAFATVRDDDATTTTLRAHVAERVPAFAVPAAVRIVGALPRMPNGKVDRRALAALAPTEPAGPPPAAAGDDALRPGLELDIAAIWQEVLGRPVISPRDDFFAIGGDSLGAIRVYNRLRGLVAAEFAITDLFKHPTIRAVAGFLEERRHAR